MNYSPNDEIPDGEVLYRYCKPQAFPEGQLDIPIAIFMDRELSCDWAKFRVDPKQSYHIEEGKTRIISITICNEIRNPVNPKRSTQKIPDWHQEIIYSPVFANEDPRHGENLAHSLIKGLKKAPICEAIVSNSTWADT